MVWEQRLHQINYAYVNLLQCHTQWFLKWFQYENWAAAWQNQQNDLCAQRRLRSAWASAQSDQSQRCPPEAKLGPKLPTERTAKTLIRLGGCPGWSESSLGTKSFCWFCHEVAQNSSSSSLHMQHIYISSRFYISHRTQYEIGLAMLTISYWANGTWCAVTVTSFDFVKDDCAVGSAVFGKRGYNISSTQSMVLFNVKPTGKKFWADRKHSNGFFDRVRNVAGCIYYTAAEKEFRTIVFLIFDTSCWHKKSSHTSQKMKQHDISSSSL